MALAGRSALSQDQGYHKHWPHALHMNKDFGQVKVHKMLKYKLFSNTNLCFQEWYVKDSLLFTPACTSLRSLPPPPLDIMCQTFDTGFGCKKLQKFRLAGINLTLNRYIIQQASLASLEIIFKVYKALNIKCNVRI